MEDMEIIEKYEVNKKITHNPQKYGYMLAPCMWNVYYTSMGKLFKQYSDQNICTVLYLFFLTLSWIVPSTIKIIGKHDF